MKRLFILAGMLSLLIACGPKPVLPPPTVVEGCPQPPADVFTQVGVDATFAQSTYGKVVVGTIDVKTQPQVVTLLSQAVTDTRVKDYLRCLAIRRDKFTPEQAAYLEQLNSFVATKPTAEQFIQWQREHPFPGTSTGPNRIPGTSGVLSPGTKELPKGRVQIPEGAMAIFLGNSMAYTTSFPHTVIEVGGDPVLVIDKTEAGIAIFAKMFSEDGRIVAELKENQFHVNPNNYFRIERPNDHSLIVYDQRGQQALNVEFLNRFAIKLLGRFYFPPRPPIIIEEERMSYGGIRMSNNTFGENRVDIGIQ